jgi:hypothetical protein
MKVRVDTCTLRRDGQWLVTYRATPGAASASALSRVEVPVGKDCVIKDGKVVKS